MNRLGCQHRSLSVVKQHLSPNCLEHIEESIKFAVVTKKCSYDVRESILSLRNEASVFRELSDEAQKSIPAAIYMTPQVDKILNVNLFKDVAFSTIIDGTDCEFELAICYDYISKMPKSKPLFGKMTLNYLKSEDISSRTKKTILDATIHQLLYNSPSKDKIMIAKRLIEEGIDSGVTPNNSLVHLYQFVKMLNPLEIKKIVDMVETFKLYQKDLELVDETILMMKMGSHQFFYSNDIETFFPYLKLLSVLPKSRTKSTIRKVLQVFTKPNICAQLNPYQNFSPHLANPFHRQEVSRSDFGCQLQRLVEFPNELVLLARFFNAKERHLLRHREKRVKDIEAQRGLTEHIKVLRIFQTKNKQLSSIPSWDFGLSIFAEFDRECPIGRSWYPNQNEILKGLLIDHYSTFGEKVFNVLQDETNWWKLRERLGAVTSLASIFDINKEYQRIELLKKCWGPSSWHPIQAILCGGTAKGAKIIFGKNKRFDKDSDGVEKFFGVLDTSLEFFNFEDAMNIIEEIGKYLSETPDDLSLIMNSSIPTVSKFWIATEISSNESTKSLINSQMEDVPCGKLRVIISLPRCLQQRMLEEYIISILYEDEEKIGETMEHLYSSTLWKTKIPGWLGLKILRRIRSDSELNKLRGQPWETFMFGSLRFHFDELERPTEYMYQKMFEESGMALDIFIITRFSNLPKSNSELEAKMMWSINQLSALLDFCQSKNMMSAMHHVLCHVPGYWKPFIRASILNSKTEILCQSIESCVRLEKITPSILTTTLIVIKEELVLARNREASESFAKMLEKLPQIFYFSGMDDFCILLNEQGLQSYVRSISHHMESQRKMN